MYKTKRTRTHHGETESLRIWRRIIRGLKESELEKAARKYTAKTGVVCDGFHPKVRLDMTKGVRRDVAFLKVEQCGRWPQQASHLRLCHTMIRWLEALRAPEVSKWQHKSRIEWDATDGRKVGAERSVDKKRRRKVNKMR